MALRTLGSDQSVKNAKLKPGTLKRIAGYATPYKAIFVIFFLALILDAVLTVATPLLLKELVDKGVVPKDGALVTKLAIIVGLLAIVTAAINVVVRWISSKIGEGLIYDLRSQVFEHVQEQSVAFFTRTQTGALISRINSDVIGAQRAFTSTFSGVINGDTPPTCL
jgi:ATP-binding cassette subfamily B protein